MQKLTAFAALLGAAFHLCAQPLNDIAFRNVVSEKPVLRYEVPHEQDILWQKRIWRVLDVREKINLPFIYPEAPLFDLLVNAAQSGELQLYSPENDDFSQPLTAEDLQQKLFKSDTVEIWKDENTMENTVVYEKLNYEDVRRFRLLEVWYFDSKASELRVRILGIAPVRTLYTESGSLIGEAPMFWVHYPEAREVLARQLVYQENEAVRMTWEDLFEMRMFSSYISKEGNVHNNRLQDIFAGVGLLQGAEKINQEIFNFEHDVWER